MNWFERRQQMSRFWKTVPPVATLILFAGVFLLFAGIGSIQRGVQATSAGATLLNAALQGGLAALLVYLPTRARFRWMAVVVVFYLLAASALHRWRPPHVAFNPVPLEVKVASWAVMAGFVLIWMFIGSQGRRFFRLQNEVELAAEIHKSLAPAINRRVDRFEFSGISEPSGLVGGDLLDWVQTGRGWLCYVADVAGHGVAAGVLMAVVKSATRTWLSGDPDGHELLDGLNRVLLDLLPEESFVTLIALTPEGGDGVTHRLRFAAAGHGPLLHYHAATRTVSRHDVENFPLGLFPNASFDSLLIECARGDILALFSDGLAEVFNARNNEFGLEGVEAALQQSATQPLGKAVSAIVAAARSFGTPTDDLTLVLIRAT